MFRQDSAQTIALQALAFLAARDEVFDAFLAQAGTDAGTLRAQATDPEVLASVMDFLLGDEALVMDFCREAGLAFDAPMRARAALPGGDIPNWT